MPVVTTDVGDKAAVPAAEHVEEKFTVTGDAADAPATLTEITDAPYAGTVVGEAEIPDNDTVTDVTVKATRELRFALVETSAAAET